jgi:hypothetical protein
LVAFEVEILLWHKVFWRAAWGRSLTWLLFLVLPPYQFIVDIGTEFLELYGGEADEFVSGTVLLLIRLLITEVWSEIIFQHSVMLRQLLLDHVGASRVDAACDRTGRRRVAVTGLSPCHIIAAAGACAGMAGHWRRVRTGFGVGLVSGDGRPVFDRRKW